MLRCLTNLLSMMKPGLFIRSGNKRLEHALEEIQLKKAHMSLS